MTTKVFVADPPQRGRRNLGIGIDATNEIYEVGDRYTYTTGGFWVYKCITGGLAPFTIFSPSAGQTPYSWGPTVWEIVDYSAGFENAAWETARGDVVNIVDYMYSLDSSSGTGSGYSTTPPGGGITAGGDYAPAGSIVFVNPATLEPLNARNYHGTRSAYFLETYPTFFGLSCGYHARPNLARWANVYTSFTPPHFVDSIVDFRSATNTVTFDWGFGIDLRMNQACRGSVSSKFGVIDTTVNKIRVYGVTHSPATPSGTITAQVDARVFGYHATVAPSNKTTYEATSNTVSVARSHMTERWRSDHYASFEGTTPPVTQADGHGGTLIRSSDCYRAAGFASWETPHALRLAWASSPVNFHPDMSRPVFAPTMIVQNSLTGARTVNFRFYTDCSIPLTNLDVWIDVFAATSATTVAYANVTSMNANYGAPWATGTNIATETGWTEVANVFQGTGYRISLPITINKASPLFVRFTVASDKFTFGTNVPGFRIYLDPNIEVT